MVLPLWDFLRSSTILKTVTYDLCYTGASDFDKCTTNNQNVPEALEVTQFVDVLVRICASQPTVQQREEQLPLQRLLLNFSGCSCGCHVQC